MQNSHVTSASHFICQQKHIKQVCEQDWNEIHKGAKLFPPTVFWTQESKQLANSFQTAGGQLLIDAIVSPQNTFNTQENDTQPL